MTVVCLCGFVFDETESGVHECDTWHELGGKYCRNDAFGSKDVRCRGCDQLTNNPERAREVYASLLREKELATKLSNDGYEGRFREYQRWRARNG